MTTRAADRRQIPLRILLTIHYPLDYNSGAAGSTLRLAEALRGLSHEVSVFGFDQMVARTGRKVDELTFPFQASATASRRLISGSLDVVEASTGDLWPLPRGMVSRARGLVVTRTYGLEHLESQAMLQARQRGEVHLRNRYFLYYGGVHLSQVARSLRVADAAVFSNQCERQFAVDNLGVEARRSTVTRTGLTDRFLDLPAPQEPLGEPGIAVLGPYAWRKGAGTAVEVLSAVLSKWPGAHASWFGARDEDVKGGLVPEVRNRVFVLPRYRLEDLPALLDGHQVLLVLSRSEGFPGVVLEGMACGLAIVATDIPGSSDMLEGSGAGILVPPGDVDRVVGEVDALLRHREELGRMRHRAYTVAQGYSWKAVASETETYYRSLIDRKRRAAMGGRGDSGVGAVGASG